MIEQKCKTIGYLREEIRFLPDDAKIMMRVYDREKQEYTYEPVEDIYNLFDQTGGDSQLILG